MSPLAAPPDDLSEFPAFALDQPAPLYRIHRRTIDPWWFSRDGSARFDLSAVGRGTCYLAEREVGAFIEVFRSGTVIPEAEVEARMLATLEPPWPIRPADCTVEAARAFGVTGAIHTQPDYALTRAWADAFASAGFEGIFFRLSHDPTQRELGVALFGPEGAQDLPVRHMGPIPARVLNEARRRFGLVVAPTPG